MEQHLPETADFRSFAKQCFYLIANAVGRNPVIVIPVHDEVALAGLHALIAFCAHSLALRRPYVFYPRISWRQVGDAILAVIQNYKFAIGIVLLQKILYRQRHKSPSVRS